jgi:hypothetical protein
MATVTASYTWVSGETVTPAKLNTTAAPVVVVDDAEITNIKLASDIDASKLTTGTLPIARIADDAVTNDKLSLAANAGEIKKALNADNAAPIYACRAWVVFDGSRNAADTGASSDGNTVKIFASGNVTSVTRVIEGRFTVTFTTALPSANYSICGSCDGTASLFLTAGYATTPSASAATIQTTNSANGSLTTSASGRVSVSFFA